MISKKNRAVSRLPISAVLNCDDRKKFAAFVGLLVQINKRINPEEYAVTERTRSKKTKKIDLERTYKEGSQNRGPLFFLISRLAFSIEQSICLRIKII
jgi:hypothetical protein